MSTTVEIRAPLEQTEGTRSQILRWLKGVGDEVAEHEPLIEIETDKVTVEVAAPATGVLLEILKNEQEEIAPGDVLGRMELPAGTKNVPDATASERGIRSATNSVAGGRAERALTEFEAAGESRAESGSISVRHAGAKDLSPAVRRLIAERGLDPTTIHGTGEGGRITVDDVLTNAASSAARMGEAQLHADYPAHQPRPATAPSSDAQVPSHSVQHTAIRKRIADHMVQSLLHTAPHVTTVFEADMTAVIAHRANNKASFEQQGAPLTFTAYFLKAAVDAIHAVPEANSRWTDAALEIYDTINIGVATALEDGGLVVPVLKGAESRSLLEIARDLNQLVTAARAGKLQPSDVRNGTFTISNHGVSGSLVATPIVINQPQSAILGVGKLEKRPTVITRNGRDEIVIQPKCYVTLTIDHRVMDGHQANRFLQTFVKTLETWPAQ